MYYCEEAHDFSGHCTDAGDYIRPVMDGFPEPDGDGNIPQVQQIISGQQRTVYEQG
jgi:hypothetical protein